MANDSYTTKRERGGIYQFNPDDMYPKPGNHSKRKSCEEQLKMHCHAFAVTDVGDDHCTGFMLTSSGKQLNNLKMRPTDFTEGYSFQYREPGGSYFLIVPLQKMPNLVTAQVGKLTEDGIAYIEGNKKGEPVTWEQYVRESCEDK